MFKVLIGFKRALQETNGLHMLQICVFSGLVIGWWSKLRAAHPYPTQVWVRSRSHRRYHIVPTHYIRRVWQILFQHFVRPKLKRPSSKAAENRHCSLYIRTTVHFCSFGWHHYMYNDQNETITQWFATVLLRIMGFSWFLTTPTSLAMYGFDNCLARICCCGL